MKIRTLFVSDIHLGTPHCQSKRFLNFLKSVEAEKIYLIGDIIDMLCMKRKTYWKQEHNTIIQKILRQARKGTQIIYVPGNHDYFFRDFEYNYFGNVFVNNQVIHTTKDERSFLVMHGDEFDGALSNMTSLYWLGSIGYDIANSIYKPIKLIRRLFGLHSHWSLAFQLKKNVKSLCSLMTKFEKLITTKAKIENANGVICGHTHDPKITTVNGIEYYNCGCWTNEAQSTAIIETLEGELKLVEIE